MQILPVDAYEFLQELVKQRGGFLAVAAAP